LYGRKQKDSKVRGRQVDRHQAEMKRYRNADTEKAFRIRKSRKGRHAERECVQGSKNEAERRRRRERRKGDGDGEKGQDERGEEGVV
jgi:hypothetical protein